MRIWDVSTGKEAMAPPRGDEPTWIRVAADIADMPLASVNEACKLVNFRDFLVTALNDQLLVYRLHDDQENVDLDGNLDKEYSSQEDRSIDGYSCSSIDSKSDEEEDEKNDKALTTGLQGTNSSTLELLAQYTAALNIYSISCKGKHVCVGLYGDEVGTNGVVDAYVYNSCLPIHATLLFAAVMAKFHIFHNM